jgi:hypothetical protein
VAQRFFSAGSEVPRRAFISSRAFPNPQPGSAIKPLLTCARLLYKFIASSKCTERSTFVNELYSWLSRQHPGLKTFKALQLKLDQLAADQPEQRAMCRLLQGIIGSYIEEFDEAPLPSAIADRAYQRLLRSLAELDSSAEPATQLGNLNRLAELHLA